MYRVYFKNILLVTLLCFGCFSCAFNSNGRGAGRISFSIPKSEVTRNSTVGGSGELLTERPELYDVKVVYADGTVVYAKQHKDGDVVVLEELASGQYDISVRGNTKDYVFMGSVVANVLEDTEWTGVLEIQAFKKGQIKLDFSHIETTENLTDFNIEILNADRKSVCNESVAYSSLGADKRYLVKETFPVGDYFIKLKGGNVDHSYRVNKDLKVNVSDGKIFVCPISEHEAITFFISANGNDENGTGDAGSPFRTINKALDLMKDINVLVRITIVDSVVENGAINLNNPNFRVTFDGKPGSSLVAKGGIKVSAGSVTLDNGLVITGGKPITVEPNCAFNMQGSAKVAEDTPVTLKAGAVVNITGDLTNDTAAIIKMAAPKNMTAVVAGKSLATSFGKLKFDGSQKYDIQDDGKAWAKLPAGYIGIEAAKTALSSGTSSIKVFVDDYTELNELGTAIKNVSASNVALDLRTNPNVSSLNSTPFSSSTKLSSIVIPSTIATVSTNAFNGCTGLTKVTFADGVKTIGTRAFSGCTGLKTVIFSNSVTAIGDSAFNGCTELKTVTIGKGVTTIGASAFTNSGLTELTVPGNVKTIGTGAFNNCANLTKATFADGENKAVGASTFSGCQNLNTVVFGNSVTAIGDSAFSNCKALVSVNIGRGVTTIGASAFKNSGLTELTVPGNVKTIGTGAFNNCTDLTKATFADGENKVVGADTFSGCPKLNTVNFGNSVTAIGDSAFNGCTELKTVTIGKGVTTIGASAFANSGLTGNLVIPGNVKNINTGAFSGCTVSSVEFGSGSGTVIGTNVFKDCTSLSSVKFGSSVKTIGDSAFNGCTELKTVTLGSGVTTIGASAFANSGLTGNLVIPGNVKNINTGAFSGCTVSSVEFGSGSGTVIGTNVFKDCTVLSSVKFGSSVKTIGNFAFNGCSGLTNITLGSGVTTIGASAFVGSGLTGELVIPGNVQTIYDSAFNGCTGITKVTFAGGSNKTIGNSAFNGCTGLKTVTLGSGVTTIGASAFVDTGLNCTIDMPASLRTIGNNAFENTAITGVKLNSGLTTIGNAAFKGCTSLNGTVTIPGTVKARNNFGTESFAGCTALDTVIIENGVTAVNNNAFENSGVSSVTIPNTVGYIYNSAFAGCTSLNSVTLNEGLITIYGNAFNGCSVLSNITIPRSVININSGAFSGTNISNVKFADTNAKWDNGSGEVLKASGGTIPLSSLTGNCSRPLSFAEARPRIKNGGNIKVAIANTQELTELGNIIKDMRSGSLRLDLRTDVSSIPSATFANCLYLTEIIISGNVTSIGKMAFANDSRLNSVTLPASISTISRQTFGSCDALSSVTFKGSPKQWYRSKFGGQKELIGSDSNPALNATNLKNNYVDFDWTVQ